MTTQVTMRLPTELVAYVDEKVTSGAAPSRAAVVAAALERSRRREIAERDAAILASGRADGDDLDGLAAFAAGIALDDLG